MDHKFDICRICDSNYQIEKMCHLFSIEVEFMLECLQIKKKVKFFICEGCNKQNVPIENFFEKIANANINLNAILPDQKLEFSFIDTNFIETEIKEELGNESPYEISNFDEGSEVFRNYSDSSWDEEKEIVINNKRQLITEKKLQSKKNEMKNILESLENTDIDEKLNIDGTCLSFPDSDEDFNPLENRTKRKLKRLKKENFTCSICQMRFRTYDRLYHHELKHKPIIQGECKICSQFFDDLEKHTRKSHEVKALCNKCGLTFESAAKLYQHNVIFHSERKHICDSCKKGYPTKSKLNEHKKSHDIVSCSQCHKSVSKRGIKAHEATHTVERKTSDNEVEMIPSELHKFKCPFCSRSLKSLTSLQSHSKTHNTELKNSELYKHVCKFCDQRFKRSDHLKIHEDKIHLKNLPFECDMCPSKFSANFALTYHKKMNHSGVKFDCNICSKLYTHQSSLQRHKRLEHLGTARRKCAICDIDFKNIRDMEIHLKSHTVEEENRSAKKLYEKLLSAQKN